MFKYSNKDIFLIILSLITVGLILYLALHFEELNVSSLCVFSLVIACLICTNHQCISHNFTHCPFFKAKSLNFSFALLNTMAMGLPQSMYRQAHLDHHQFTNDKKCPKTGKVKDLSSVYKYSINNEPEPLLTYSFLGVFRGDTSSLIKKINKRGYGGHFKIEIVIFLIFITTLIGINWKFFLFFYLPTYYIGQVLAYAQNYFEHLGATGEDRKNNSVSCYNSLYNFLWFNNGYHQEHHYRPGIHWTKIKEVKKLMLPESDRKIVPYVHFFNWPKRWFNSKF